MSYLVSKLPINLVIPPLLPSPPLPSPPLPSPPDVVDYSLPFDTLSFPLSLLTGSTEQAVVRCVRVFVTSHDSVLESDETYQLVLANSDVILLPRTTTVTILDDDSESVMMSL